MTTRMIKSSGLEALNLATRLLQRVRLADDRAGLWEAADVQWSWRQPRRSDAAEKLFWLDEEGPVAGVLLTSGAGDSWQCDPVIVPGIPDPSPSEIWQLALEHIAEYSPTSFEIPVGKDNRAFRELVQRSGFTSGDSDYTAWMDATDRPEVLPIPDGFVITNRGERRYNPHHMIDRSGEDIAHRLEQCSLYDPSLDLAIESIEGRVAGYSLYWFDPVTNVGLVEPVRVEDDFQRKGLARAMLTVGLDELVKRGATRIKVSYETEAAGKLYEGVGFRMESTTTWYRAKN